MTQTAQTLQSIRHWVDNAPFDGASKAGAPVTNLATGVTTGQVALASVEDARAVIDAAAAAFPAWRDTSLVKRTQVLFRFRELLIERRNEIAAIITSEHGKVLFDAACDVSRGQKVVEFACGIPHMLKDGFTENASTMPIPVPMAYYSFGGWKASLFGDSHATAWTACSSSPARKPSPNAGSTRATGDQPRLPPERLTP